MEEVNPSAKGPAGRPIRLLACSGSLDGGGSERQLWQLVCQLDRQRFAPEVYLLHRRGPYLEKLPADVPVHAFDADCPNPGSFPPGRISRLQSRHLRRVVQTRHIDLVYDRTFHMTLLTGWALPTSQPRVSVIVSPPSRDLPGTERRFLTIKHWLLARAYRTAQLTVCVSHEVADDAAAYYGLPRERFIVLPNPIDTKTVRQLAAAPRALTGAGLNVVVVGRFTAEKGHRFAIDVVRALRDESAATLVHLHFVGDGPLKSELQSLIAQQALEAVIHLHGYQTNPYSNMAAADLVMVPSRYEGFPNVALEAMALGLPLLMTNYCPTAQVIAGEDQSRAELVPVDDVAAAVRAMRDRIVNPARWQARAKVAQSWVEREHALTPWLESMMNLLEQVAATRQVRA